MSELSEEDVFANDIDPLDAISEIRRAEGVTEDELQESDDETSSSESEESPEDEDELANLDKNSDSDEEEEEEEEDSDETKDEDNTDSEKDDEPAESAKRKFMADGREYEFTEEEMLEQFGTIFGQAVGFTQKTQKLAPYRKMISALEEEDITADQLNVAIDAIKGNKSALKTLMALNEIDAYDVDNEENENNQYTPTVYGKDDTQLGIEEVTNSISKDAEYKITVDVIDNQWDNTSRQALSNNPTMIQGLHNDIKSGVYDKVAPIAMKMKVLDGNTKSSIEYYMIAGEQVTLEENKKSAQAEKSVTDKNKQAQGVKDEFDQASSEADRKRSASPTRKRADRKGVIDYLDDDEEDYDAWYKKLMASN